LFTPPDIAGSSAIMKLHVRAVPNSRKSEIIGWEEDPSFGRVLRIKVGAPAVEGKANAELTAFLAKTLGLPKSKVVLGKGDGSRFKTFEIPDGTDLNIAG
jgi:uncharacterized protein (TIGR00251 family)